MPAEWRRKIHPIRLTAARRMFNPPAIVNENEVMAKVTLIGRIQILQWRENGMDEHMCHAGKQDDPFRLNVLFDEFNGGLCR